MNSHTHEYMPHAWTLDPSERRPSISNMLFDGIRCFMSAHECGKAGEQPSHHSSYQLLRQPSQIQATIMCVQNQ